MPIRKPKPTTSLMQNSVLANQDRSRYILRGTDELGRHPMYKNTHEAIEFEDGRRMSRDIMYRHDGQNDTTITFPSGHQMASKVSYQNGVPVREYSTTSPEGEVTTGGREQRILNREAERFDTNKAKYINAAFNKEHPESDGSFYDRAAQLKRTGQFEQGGLIDCIRGGKPYHECKKCGGKIPSAKEGEKIRRTDRPGYAYTLPNGIDVLTQDAVGSQPLPGSYYVVEGSSPEMETQRTVITDKGGNPLAYNYNVYTNDGDHIFPTNRYTTKRMLIKPSTWLRRELTPERAAEMKAAYDANMLKFGGCIEKRKK